SLKFLIDQRVPVPNRIDFSCYINRRSATYLDLVSHIFDDADASLAILRAPKSYGIAETYYFVDDIQRKEYGRAFTLATTLNPRLSQLRFWTTPDGGGPGINIAYPLVIEDFLLSSSITVH
ncbi:unnamed protein product, partial [Rotaria sp. Silwood2]